MRELALRASKTHGSAKRAIRTAWRNRRQDNHDRALRASRVFEALSPVHHRSNDSQRLGSVASCNRIGTMEFVENVLPMSVDCENADGKTVGYQPAQAGMAEGKQRKISAVSFHYRP